MNRSRAFVTVGLFFGDEGKGTIVDALTRRYNVPLNVRYSGGAQCAHNVVTSEGVHHTFAQFGSGTFAGAETVLTNDVLIDPLRLMNEATVLENKGIARPCSKMYIGKKALVITPFHRLLNRARELARGENRHGSCGIGVGETRRYAIRYPDKALRVEDLLDFDRFKSKTSVMRDDLRMELETVFGGISPKEGYDEFYSPDFMSRLYPYYARFIGSGIRFFSEHEIISLVAEKNSVWEAAQGVLLDEDYGFHPYTTWSKVTSENAHDILKLAGVSSVETIGIMRSYAHRHGAGPFPTEDKDMTRIMSEPHNPHNPWQHGFRKGFLDISLLDYGIHCTGGVDYLAVTHLDKIGMENKVAIDYIDRGILPFYVPPRNLELREEYTHKLMNLDRSSIIYKTFSKEEFVPMLTKELGAPVKITSFGPMFGDKVFA